MNFDELPIYDEQCQEVRRIVRDELKQVSEDTEIRNFLSAATGGFVAVAGMLAVGATTIFGMDCWHFFQAIPNYQPVTSMPWSAAGALSSAMGLFILTTQEL